MTSIKRFSVVCSLGLGLVLACGDNKPPPKTEDTAKTDSTSGRSSSGGPVPVVQQELGSVDQKAVEKKFDTLQGQLETCHKQGRDRVDVLSGDVKVFLRIDQGGKVTCLRRCVTVRSDSGGLRIDEVLNNLFSFGLVQRNNKIV